MLAGRKQGSVVCFAPLCSSAWPHLTFRVCTPSPQLSRVFTKVTLQTLQGSATHKCWLQSLWQGTTSYTCNTHSSQWSPLRSLKRVPGQTLHHNIHYILILATFISLHCYLKFRESSSTQKGRTSSLVFCCSLCCSCRSGPPDPI